MSELNYEPKVKYAPSPPRQSSGILRTLAIFGCAVVFLCCFSAFGIGAGFTALAAATEANEQTRTVTETLTVEDEANINLEVENGVGDITINGSRTAQNIEVTFEMRATGFSDSRAQEKLDKLEYEVERDENDYIIKVEGDNDVSFFDLSEAKVDITITVPESINLTVSNDVGNLVVRNVIIRDELELTVDVGEVEFEGQIGPEGEHSITTNVGGIIVQVTHDSAFNLDAQTDVGEILPELELADKDEDTEVVSQQLIGVYGDDDPEATLTLFADVGVIEIRD